MNIDIITEIFVPIACFGLGLTWGMLLFDKNKSVKDKVDTTPNISIPSMWKTEYFKPTHYEYPYPHGKGVLTTEHLRKCHPELNDTELVELLEFSKGRTISHIECYGDGTTMFPMWKESKNTNNA